MSIHHCHPLLNRYKTGVALLSGRAVKCHPMLMHKAGEILGVMAMQQRSRSLFMQHLLAMGG